MTKHTDDLRNVRSGDTIDIETTRGHDIRVECTSRRTQYADPRTGHIRETTVWTFDYCDDEVACSITDGLKSHESDPEFPTHSGLWNIDEQEGLGYIESLSIYGEMEA